MGRAVGFTEFGEPEVLHELDVEPPILSAGEVRIRVAAATVNPTDTYLRSGQYAEALTRFDRPWIPGMEAAGVVVEVGQGVRTVAVGDQVLAVVTPMRPRGGAYTEVLVVPAGSVVRAPRGVPVTRSVTLAMNGLTAQRALDVLGLEKGAVLAVTGTTGMVGGLAAQLAVRAGLEVRPVGREPLPGDAEALIDAAAMGVASWVTVRPGGSVAALRPVQPGRSDAVLHRVAVSDYLEEATRLAPLVAAAERDELLVPEVIELDAADAVRAHRLIATGRTRPRPVLCF